MNIFLLKKIKNISVSIIFISFFCFPIVVSSQQFESGNPLTQFFHPKEYGYESQNYSIAKDKYGIMYFGNLSGILQYDGTFWKLIKFSGKPILASDNQGNIYAGGFNDFGYLKYNSYLENEYVSIVDKYMPEERFGAIEKVICWDNKVFFCSEKKIYCWDGKKVDLFNSSNEYINAFVVENNLYIYKYGYGLYKYVKDRFKLMPNGDFFKDKLIIDILDYSGDLLIKMKDVKNFFIYNYNGITEVSNKLSEIVDFGGYKKGLKLSNGHYAFSTKTCGVIIAHKSGEVIATINKNTGLAQNIVNDIFFENNNLWMALNNGLAKSEYPSPYSFYNESSGLQGGIYSVIRFSNSLYLSTSTGVYFQSAIDEKLNESCYNNKQFRKISGINAQCYYFFRVFNRLFITSETGLFEISEDKAEQITYGQLRSILQSSLNPDILYICNYDGIHILKNSSKGLVELGKLKNFDLYIRTIVEDSNHVIWMGSDFNGIVKFIPDTGDYLTGKFEFFNSGDFGLPKEYDWVDVYKTTSGVLFSTFKGIFRYNYENKKFEKDLLLGLNQKENNRWVYPIHEDKSKNIWFSSGFHNEFRKKTGVLNWSADSGKYISLQNTYNELENFTVECIYTDRDSVVWIGGTDGLFRINHTFKDPSHKRFITLITKIIYAKDSVVNHGVEMSETNDGITYFNENDIRVFPYKNNKIHFEFSSPFYKYNSKVMYKYYLAGLEETWSSAEDINVKEYTNLDPGEYTFFVKSIDCIGNESLTSSYRFVILPPFYKKWWFLLLLSLLVISFILMVIRWRNYLFEKEKSKLEKTIAERTEELVKEKERAEELINNFMPKQMAEEIRTTGKLKRKRFRLVTVLFSDVKGFTKVAQKIGQDALLNELDKYFLKFDSVVDTYNIEKIKTIGDAYMCAGGIPTKNRTNPIEVVLAALNMQQYMNDLKKKHENIWDIRIGIHTGEVIAGIVGSKRYSYDIWGDAVNVASRMESLGEPGEIHISHSTYELVKQFFDCEYRGNIPVKYHGEISTYFVKGLKPEFCETPGQNVPNKKFLLKLQYIRFDDLDEYIMTKLERGLKPEFNYHNLKHTIDVCTQVEILGRSENVNEEEMLLLKTAALFHDTGFLVGQEDHEFLGIKMAKDILPKYQYTEEQIRVISELIYATKLPPSPRNLLEQIMCDADLDYLGRPDFGSGSQALFYELIKTNRIRSLNDWNKMQVKFIENHQYFTESARKKRSLNKMQQLDELKKIVELIRQEEEAEKMKKKARKKVF
jgi:adenylate cyclase